MPERLAQAERPPSREKTIVLLVHYVNLSKSLINSWGFEWTPFAATQSGGSLAFEENRMGVDQILAVKPSPAGRSDMPASPQEWLA